ncbi:hypothetical protein VTN00DRAFT_4073 [Thermoascus crustaceus]|uniref:uncharacterized protein n=1 Tax=Thermoascus crustaceus TaxID=5088 RepID=UPI003741EE82
MAWDHLDIDKPHVAYMILGGFTALFMLCSLFVKEKLYIGEATVATLCGIIFGPHAANLFVPDSWGNVDKITLECSRIVLVVQCFAVGVELPKAYMERHWKSVVLLLLPVMTWGWLVTSLFIWWMVPPLTWLESLACAACVTATDPVLASSVVGKGKFARRVPKHLRDLLSAESGCNDGMAFPFIYLAIYIIRYLHHPNEVALHWICVTILYECIAGAIFGFTVGYVARHAIKFAERKSLIDRESFLVFYFVLALFCAGSGSLLGMDDLLIGFSAGVGFSNDGWFTEKTEESHVSNVIDLLLNLAYFVYFGSIIPWGQYNAPEIGLIPWRLVIIAIFVILFRRIPIMLILKPIIPDVKTWREALFAGHFGPIGVGAIFAAILARAELEHESTQPLPIQEWPRPGSENYYVVQLIWPITTFMVIASIIVHGSSIAVFTLGKRINTLTITMSYTTEDGPSWMNRLPRVSSLSKSSMSLRRADSEVSEKMPEFPPGTLPPVGLPRNFLRRVKEEDNDSASRASSLRPLRRRKRENGAGAGGPISQSAIAPVRRPEAEEEEKTTSDEDKEVQKEEAQEETEEENRIERGRSPPRKERERFGREPELEIYREGDNLIIEDEEGNVLKTEDVRDKSAEQQEAVVMEQHRRLQSDKSGQFAKSKSRQHGKTEGKQIQEAVDERVGHPYEKLRKRLEEWAAARKEKEESPKGEPSEKKPKDRTRRSAHAYQFGNTIIVEDEDGEVVKKYTIPSADKARKGAEAAPEGAPEGVVKRGLSRMGTWVGMGEKAGEPSKDGKKKSKDEDEDSDDGLRFTLARDVGEGGIGHQGRRMSKQDFIKEFQKLDPKARREMVDETDAPGSVKQAAHKQAKRGTSTQIPEDLEMTVESPSESSESERDIPAPDIAASLAKYSGDSAAQERRRRLSAAESPSPTSKSRRRRDSDDDGTERIPPSERRRAAGLPTTSVSRSDDLDEGETPAERKRRLAALGELRGDDESDEEAVVSDSEDDGEPRVVRGSVVFADGTRPARRKQGAGGVSLEPTASGASGDDNGNSTTSSFSRTHRPRVSWGGERREGEDGFSP